MEHPGWPALSYRDWAPTKKTLQMCSQMLGKVRLGLAPPQPEWLHASLQLDPRGFATGAMPCGERLVSMGLDLWDGVMWVQTSDGESLAFPIAPDRPVADIYNDMCAMLDQVDVTVDLWQKPQELADTTPFADNTHDRTLVLEDAQRFHEALCTIQGVFDEFRSGFFGRTGVQFWWGAFDLAVLLFSGRHEAAPEDKGYIMRYDLDAEHFNAGFWPGDDSAPTPSFYGYLVPRPEGCETAPIQPAHAAWVDEMGEWMLSYDAVRTCEDPRKALLDFLGSVYRVALAKGGWDEVDFEYVEPAPSKRG